MKLTFYTSSVLEDRKNSTYPQKVTVRNASSLLQATAHDYVCAEYRGGRRGNSNFLRSDCLALDCDNDHTNDPSGFITPEDVKKAFPDVAFCVHYSRNDGKEKNGAAPRPRFHVFFPIEVCANANAYAALKRQVCSAFPYFDTQALDAGRFFFGTAKPKVLFVEGELTLTEYIAAHPEWFAAAQAERAAGVSALQEAKNPMRARAQTPFDAAERHIKQGERNTTLHHFAVKALKRYGATQRAADIFVREAELCDPPLPEEELKSIFDSALHYYETTICSDPSYVPPQAFNTLFRDEERSLCPDDFSDIGQAKVLLRECGNELRFTEGTDLLRYDGHCWQESVSRATRCAQEFLDLQLADAEDELSAAREALKKLGAKETEICGNRKYGEKLANDAADEEQAKLLSAAFKAYAHANAYLSFVMQRRDMKYVNSCLQALRPMIELEVSRLDADPYLLNTPQATYDLAQGMAGAREQLPGDFITRMTAFTPSEKGKELWEEALNTFFHADAELIDYVQRIVGLAAIGKVQFEQMIIAYGDGRNGKSTFWNSISKVLGSYAGQMSADTLTVGCKRNVKPEMAELKGRRLIIAAELEEGMRLNTAMVKQLCSTDEIYAEKKYKAPFSFRPSHTLVLYTNHLPRVGASDAGTWRRLIVIPFTAKIEGRSDIKNYSDYLVTHAGEYIMQWIIEGAEKVIRGNYDLPLPACVKAAVAAYRDANDWLGNFISECCETGENYRQKSGELYLAYREYCQRTGEWARSNQDFVNALENIGFEKKRDKTGSYYFGIVLKSD